jgi:hypothetical protein
MELTFRPAPSCNREPSTTAAVRNILETVLREYFGDTPERSHDKKKIFATLHLVTPRWFKGDYFHLQLFGYITQSEFDAMRPFIRKRFDHAQFINLSRKYLEMIGVLPPEPKVEAAAQAWLREKLKPPHDLCFDLYFRGKDAGDSPVYGLRTIAGCIGLVALSVLLCVLVVYSL